MRFLAFFLILTCFTQSIALATPECDVALAADQALKSARADVGRVQRLILTAMDRRLKRSILEECNTTSHCSEADVKRIVEKTVSDFNKKSKTYRAYGIIMGIWASGMGVMIYLNSNPTTRPYASVTGLVMGAVLMCTISQIWSMASDNVTKFFSRITGRGANAEIRGQSDNEMKDYSLRTSSTIGPLAQIGGQRLNQFLDSLDVKLSTVRTALRDNDELLAVNALTEIVMRTRGIFPEITREEVLVSRLVETSRIAYEERAAALYEPTLALIKKFDPTVATDKDLREYYETLLRSWLKLEP